MVRLKTKLTQAIRVFARYQIARKVLKPFESADIEQLDTASDLLGAVMEKIETGVAEVLRCPMDGLFDRQDAIAKIVESLQQAASLRARPDYGNPSRRLATADLARFAPWVRAAVDAPFPEDSERINIGIPKSWPMQLGGGPGRRPD